MARVIVVGAGVVGLTCAVRLLEAGHRVDVLARDLPLETTSSVAAAFWSPPPVADERVRRWALRSLAVLTGLGDEPSTGVLPRFGTEVSGSRPSDPWWAGEVADFRRTHVPGHAGGWSATVPVVEMPVHLAWLRARVEQLDGTITRLNLGALPQVDGLVVDCSGIGARLLAQDHTVGPVRGQVVRVEQVGLEEWWHDEEGPTYVVPRSRDIVVGGTREDGEWSRTPSTRATHEILARADRLVPGIAGARVLQAKVGLRPSRPVVRLERVGDVIHCYGHGGVGVTLSWGCADDVVGLAG